MTGETWRATYSGKTGQHSICTNERVEYGETSKLAVVLTSGDPFRDMELASLMAAAPELLTELQRHCKNCASQIDRFNLTSGKEVITQLCIKCPTGSLITKATGGRV